jgi:hypothetical protein
MRAISGMLGLACVMCVKVAMPMGDLKVYQPEKARAAAGPQDSTWQVIQQFLHAAVPPPLCVFPLPPGQG